MIPFVDLKRAQQHYGEEVNAQIAKVVDATQFILGPEVRELEDTLKEFVGVKHGIAVSSGTDALLLSLMACDVGVGDEVVTTPFTFISTSEVISFLGAKPVFVDIDPSSYNIDPSQLEQVITEKTKAILPVSLYGQCADFDAIRSCATNHGNLPVIEDACQSFGATWKGKPSCSLSDMACTSFFPSKPFGCYGDGGMIFTDQDSLAEKMRVLRVHGQDKRYHHKMIGLNARLDTLQAAVLLGKWPHFLQEIDKREKAAHHYMEGLKTLEGVLLPKSDPDSRHIFAQFSIQVDGREELRAHLQEEGIPTAIHYPIPLHLQPAFAYLGYGEGDFPISESVAKKIMSLPFHPYILKEEQDKIIASLVDHIGRH